MIQKLSHITINVRDYDEALAFYTEKLGFELRADMPMNGKARWVTVASVGQQEIEFVLFAVNPVTGVRVEEENIGKTFGWIFQTSDCRGTYETLKARGVNFLQSPTQRPYAIEALFEDLYGNKFLLTQPNSL
jgi:catechol 2,3-dioxygenase-like lactoylglutathione lyase family enzyme